LTDYDSEGGDWSILNYFDTNPQVRKIIVLELYEKETGKVLDNTEVYWKILLSGCPKIEISYLKT
jgi:hypothetical protein